MAGTHSQNVCQTLNIRCLAHILRKCARHSIYGVWHTLSGTRCQYRRSATQTQTQTQAQAQTQTQTQTQTHRHRHRYTHTGTDTHAHTHTTRTRAGLLVFRGAKVAQVNVVTHTHTGLLQGCQRCDAQIHTRHPLTLQVERDRHTDTQTHRTHTDTQTH